MISSLSVDVDVFRSALGGLVAAPALALVGATLSGTALVRRLSHPAFRLDACRTAFSISFRSAGTSIHVPWTSIKPMRDSSPRAFRYWSDSLDPRQMACASSTCKRLPSKTSLRHCCDIKRTSKPIAGNDKPAVSSCAMRSILGPLVSIFMSSTTIVQSFFEYCVTFIHKPTSTCQLPVICVKTADAFCQDQRSGFICSFRPKHISLHRLCFCFARCTPNALPHFPIYFVNYWVLLRALCATPWIAKTLPANASKSSVCKGFEAISWCLAKSKQYY